MNDFLQQTTGDYFFQQNPHKIAGVEYKTTSRLFPIQVKGTKTDVLRVTGSSISLEEVKKKSLTIKKLLHAINSSQ